jgi:hypothetical protein
MHTQTIIHQFYVDFFNFCKRVPQNNIRRTICKPEKLLIDFNAENSVISWELSDLENPAVSIVIKGLCRYSTVITENRQQYQKFLWYYRNLLPRECNLTRPYVLKTLEGYFGYYPTDQIFVDFRTLKRVDHSDELAYFSHETNSNFWFSCKKEKTKNTGKEILFVQKLSRGNYVSISTSTTKANH